VIEDNKLNLLLTSIVVEVRVPATTDKQEYEYPGTGDGSYYKIPSIVSFLLFLSLED
jgi:hypothetical protein